MIQDHLSCRSMQTMPHCPAPYLTCTRAHTHPHPRKRTYTRAQVISTARTCNLILIILDCLKPLTHKRLIEKELEGGWNVEGQTTGCLHNKQLKSQAIEKPRDGTGMDEGRGGGRGRMC